MGPETRLRPAKIQPVFVEIGSCLDWIPFELIKKRSQCPCFILSKATGGNNTGRTGCGHHLDDRRNLKLSASHCGPIRFWEVTWSHLSRILEVNTDIVLWMR